MSASLPKVIYIAGTPRCGSTLLDRLLSLGDDVVSVGELNRIWKTGMIGNAVCSCGERFHDCEFWSEVIRKAFGTLPRSEVLHLHRAWKKVVRFKNIRQLRRSREQTPPPGPLSDLAAATARLYAAIQAVSGCKLIVETSKNCVCPFFLSVIEQIELSVIHLIRDSRGIAYSWQKKDKIHHWEDGQPVYMESQTLAKSSRDWIRDQVTALLINGRETPLFRLRYEDLAADPQGTLLLISEFLERLWNHRLNTRLETTVEQDRETVANFATDHIFSGNPVRFEVGKVRISPDTEWRRSMNWKDRFVTTTLTLPLLLRFGYRL